VKYTIFQSDRSERDLLGIFLHIAKDSVNIANDYCDGLERKINSLKLSPKRGKKIGTNKYWILYRSHFIFYSVHEKVKEVKIHHIRHVMKKPIHTK